MLGLPLRTAVLTGLALAQIGEFSFVLSESGLRLGLLETSAYQAFLAMSVLTMLATPFLIGKGESVAALALKLPFSERLKSGLRRPGESQSETPLNNHLIIIGFGLTGRNLSRAAAAAGIPRVVVELNPDTVRQERAKGELIIYGDASQPAVIEHVAVKRARVMVIVISDPIATNRIVHTARRLNPKLYIIARTRFASQIEPLYEVGADEAIPEEYEASIEVLVRVLVRYLVPRGDIERLIAEFRADHYSMLRSVTHAGTGLADLALSLPDTEIVSLRVCPKSEVIGKSLGELDFRSAYGATVLAIKRDSNMIPNPLPEDKFQERDVVLILGAPDKIAHVADRFQSASHTCETE
jgi:CPA2 family monovalent cation:H+ antiporter-2